MVVWSSTLYGASTIRRHKGAGALFLIFLCLSTVGSLVSQPAAVACAGVAAAAAMYILLEGLKLQRQRWRATQRLCSPNAIEGVITAQETFVAPESGEACVYSCSVPDGRTLLRGANPQERLVSFFVQPDGGPPVRVATRNLVIALSRRATTCVLLGRPFMVSLAPGTRVIAAGDLGTEPYVAGTAGDYRRAPQRAVLENAVVTTLPRHRLRSFFQRPAVAAALVAAVLASAAWIFPAELRWGWRVLDMPAPGMATPRGTFMSAETARKWNLQRLVKARGLRIAGCLAQKGKVEARVDFDGWVGFFADVPETHQGCLREQAQDVAMRPGPAVAVDVTDLVFPVSEPSAR